MHFSLRQLWRLILYHVKNCKWLCQTALGWADVGMKHGRGNCSWCRESQGEHVDSIALSHWGPKKQLCHNSTHGGVGWSLGEILSLSAPLCILFILLQVQVRVCVYVKVSVLAQLLWAKLRLLMWNPCSFSGAWFVTDGKVRRCGQFPVQPLATWILQILPADSLH